MSCIRRNRHDQRLLFHATYWSKTPHYVRKTWFTIYTQKYNWALEITERVRKNFIAKAKVRLLDTVSNWKGDWIVK
ncbi:unnamed protein product, partial [Brassica oleracea]